MAARDRESEEAAENLPWPLQMEQQVNPLERDHDLAVVLPGGLEKNATVHGRWELRLMCLVLFNIYINSFFFKFRSLLPIFDYFFPLFSHKPAALC